MSPEQYGKGYKIVQQMGYSGMGPLGTRRDGIIEPIQLQTKAKNDKTGLGYGKNTPSK